MKRSIVFLMMALFIASCKKEGSNPVESIGSQEKVTDYFPLTVGNYWIYEYYMSDSTLNFIDKNVIDSTYVEKDSIYNGNVYAVVRSSYWSKIVTLIRDSSDYLVMQKGQKLFTINQNNSNLFDGYMSYPDTTYYYTLKMKNSDSICSVPSGQYQAKYVIGTVTSTVPNLPAMTKRNFYYAYEKGVGLVYERQGDLFTPIYFEERLVRYHVNGKTY